MQILACIVLGAVPAPPALPKSFVFLRIIALGRHLALLSSLSFRSAISLTSFSSNIANIDPGGENHVGKGTVAGICFWGMNFGRISSCSKVAKKTNGGAK